MKKIWLLVITICLTSCFSMNRPSYDLFETYQIGNTSSGDIAVTFFEHGEPKMVYAEIKDSAFSLNLSLTRKNCDELWSGNRMKLSAGQTAVIYGDAFYPGNDSTYKLCAVNFSECGQSNGQLRLFHLSSRYIGDSATLSVQGADASILPLQDIKQWETWYDEAKGMYYHCWRIDNLHQTD